MKRHGRYFVALGVLLAATIALTLLLVPGSAWVALDQRRSSMRTTPDGIAAWSRSLERLGIPVTARFTSLTAQPPQDGALVMLEPTLSPTAAEIGVLLEWIRAGGVVVYSPMFESLLFDSLGLDIVARGRFGEEPYTAGSLLPHRWTDGVEGDADAGPWLIAADSVRADSWVPLAIAPDAPEATLAWVPEGAGGVLAVADATPVTNGALGESTLPVVLTRALADLLAPGDTVRFSEFHHGLDGRRGLVRESLALAAASPVGRAGLHAAAVALLLLVLVGRSFGAPAPVPEGARRSPLEHVEALGRIYETSGSRRSVARRLVRGAARRIGVRARTSEPLLLQDWLQHPQASPHAEAAMAAWIEDPPDLAALARALDSVVAAHTTHTEGR